MGITEKKAAPSKLKSFFDEFREFAVKGNMIDLAVGIIVGGAFSAVVNSVVSDLVTPLIGILIGVDFKAWAIELPKLYGNAEPGILAIGSFLNSLISFVIVTFIVFLFIKAMNRFRNKEEETPTSAPEPTKEELLLAEIRDILKKQS